MQRDHLTRPTPTDEQLNCREPIIDLPDGSLGCPRCGYVVMTAEEYEKHKYKQAARRTARKDK